MGNRIELPRNLFAGKTADNEFRFSLNLLGVGGVLTTRVGASDSGPRLK